MNYFGSDRLVLSNESARKLYAACRQLPVFDYHNHLSPQLLYGNRCFRDMAEFLLGGDHYLWRVMRLAGLEERLITGDAPGEEKFHALVGILDSLVGCQLYAWIQMQMSFLFGESELLRQENAAEVYKRCSALLQTEDFKPRSILRRFGVRALCTTDEPFDSLEWHELLRNEVSDLRVLPAFRPDKLLAASKDTWLDSIRRLEKSEGASITSLSGLKNALSHSLDRFCLAGCVTSDHGYEGLKYVDPTGADEAFLSALSSGRATVREEELISSELLRWLGGEYCRRGMVMQLHFGALRNGNTKRFLELGADCGVDSVDEPVGVRCIIPLLDTLEKEDLLPKTILYCLNDSEYSELATACASFASPGVRCKVQLGSAWWFNDHERGMRLHLTTLMENGLLPGFVGMLTDSRSLGSFVRHDYFRRVLCDTVGYYVERGEFPLESAKRIISDICYSNAVSFFGGLSQ